MAATAAATATIPPWTCRAPTPESGASVVAAAVSLLEVRVVRELVSVEVSVPVVDEVSVSVVELSVAVVVESVIVEDSSVVVAPVAEAVSERVEAPDDAGRDAVPSAPATVKAGAKLKLVGSSSSVMRNVYSPSAVTASAGIVKEAVPSAAGTAAAQKCQ